MFENLPKRVKVVEVGPRDGLQNESKLISSADKVHLIEALAKSGLTHIEITSFVSPKWIPQLADGLEVAQTIAIATAVKTMAVVPNMQGYEAAKKAGIQEISLIMSASESHSKKNINKTIAEALDTLAQVTASAKADSKTVRTHLSVVFGCPYEGAVSPQKVKDICEKLISFGVDEIALCDTIGAATPKAVWDLIKYLESHIDRNKFALHLHDTRGTALANVLTGLEAGITTFDASIGGMGGCPYAPGASGNLASEDLVYLLHSFGIETGVDMQRLIACARLAEEIVGHPLPSKYLRYALAQSSTNLKEITL